MDDEHKGDVMGKKKTITNLPSDIVISNILPRVPASSLLRFKSVCKSWQASIRDPAFVDMNLKHALDNRHTSYRVLVFDQQYGNLVSLDEAMSHPRTILTIRRYVRISPPCNGLVCIYSYSDIRFGLQLLNPTTREILTLPMPGYPCPTSRTYHLGFDPSTNKYKLVSHSSVRFEFEMLTVGTDTSWRKVGFIDCVDSTPHKSAVIGGFLFRVMEDCKSRKTVAVSFDVCEEKFKRLSLPGDHFSIGNVFDVEGKACYSEEYDRRIFTYGLHLWMLMDVEQEVWVHRCLMPAIGLDEVRIRGYPKLMVGSRPIVITKEKLLLCNASRFYYLWLRSGVGDGGSADWEEVHAPGDDFTYCHAYAFVGNLASLKTI